ncbi:unnamed protein product [Oppiella nova]|uniref:Peptidase S1 domain-containing protein n=1 Tax=Oppiella nova TaxID=334625 RepID=A0A7R9QJP7_9ACAR|nr:unnamed protein product [Oppiella nova]CAG2166671.1 unnamed protein product [Oppiella nova]
MIYGGQDAKPGDNPHMCSLRENGRHACGASIIGNQWVVTAAHCVLKYGTHIVENSTFILHCAIAGQDTDVAPGSIVKTIGWGLTSPTTFPEILQTLDVPVIKRGDCQSIYKINPDNFTVDETSICAGGGGREPCSMDSGSPLTFNNTLVGLTSWGKPCGHPGFPTVFTRVAKFRDWIREHTGI